MAPLIIRVRKRAAAVRVLSVLLAVVVLVVKVESTPLVTRFFSANCFAAPVVGPYGSWLALADDLGENEDFDSDAVCSGSPGGKTEGEDSKSPFAPRGAAETASNFFSWAPPWALREEDPLPNTHSDKGGGQDAPFQTEKSGASSSAPERAGPVSAAKTFAEGRGLEGGECGSELFFAVNARDASGRPVRDADGTVRLRLESIGFAGFAFDGSAEEAASRAAFDARGDDGLETSLTCFRRSFGGASQSSNPVFEWQVKSAGEGVFGVCYSVDRPGQFRLHVTYDGLPIAGTPFEVFLTSGRASPLASRVVGTGVLRAVASFSWTIEALKAKTPDGPEATPGESGEDLVLPERLTQSPLEKFQGVNVNAFKVFLCDDLGKAGRSSDLSGGASRSLAGEAAAADFGRHGLSGALFFSQETECRWEDRF